ncbi:MAG TPA: RNaseH domain-containing protein [Ktedonobacteraceae bacterium]|nr:RNaseH domain-containing protein [Ktedonobacteraceae bacterium]
MAPSFSIVPMRFRIDETYLRNMTVSFSNFAYEQDCMHFLDSMKQFMSDDTNKTPPYRRLNTVLTALAPTLAHPFLARYNVDTQLSERQMLVVGTDATHRPKPEQISDLAYEWGKQWGYSSFKKVVEGAGREAHQRLLDRLQRPAQQWQERDAASLFLNLEAGTQTGYRAIPSVLASLMAGKQSHIHGKTITWRLMQDGAHGLAVISNPFLAQYEDAYLNKKEGTFAYKLEFCLQTQAGSLYPWLHLYIRCTRYVDKLLKDTNFRRDVSVKVGIDRPRLSGWGWSPTLVTLPLTGGVSNPSWQEDPVQLLSAMKARDLVAPGPLLQIPQNYRAASPLSLYDEYFVVHAEGFKPKHEVKTGFDFAELREVARAVGDILGLELSEGQTFTSDILIKEMYRQNLPLMMYGVDDLRGKKFVRKRTEQAKEESEQQNRLIRQKIMFDALWRAAGHQRIYILLCWSDTLSRTVMEQEIRQALFLERDETWPEHITLIVPPTPIPSELVAPLDPGALNPLHHYKKFASHSDRQTFLASWKTQMRKSFREKTQQWKDYLSSILPAETGYGMALIELHKLDPKNTYSNQHIKGAVRRSCNKLGLASQMFFPIRQDKQGVTGESKGRTRNSIADLIYRQTGLVYDRPVALYEKAGLPHPQAERLHLIGLYKLRKHEPKIDFPMAVRLSPDGTFQALLPLYPLQWLPLLQAQKTLGELFTKGKEKGNEEILKLSKEAQTQFAAHIFTDSYNESTLVLLEAQDWRNHDVLPQFANGRAVAKDQLDLSAVKTFERLYTRKDLPYLRIIRVRPSGSGETPQYFAVSEDEEELKEEKDLKHLTGFVDTQTASEFFHYLSVGSIPTTAATEQKNKLGLYKTDEGGGISFKHQTIVEFVPFFLQAGDDPQVWCHIPHFMRISPGWDGGNIVFPYPMHLAKCMIEDQLCIMDGGLNEEGT